jgi:hypothetical protein
LSKPVSSEPLLYRRQFVVTPRRVELPGWSLRTVASHNVYAHPDLPVTVHTSTGGAEGPESSLVLLGFAIDPDHPERDDTEVLAGLAESWRRGTEQDTLDRLSGRFALFAFCGSEIVVHIDATGTRTVEYVWTGDEFHAASQSFLLAAITPLRDGGRAKQFLGSSYARSDREAFLPASGHAARSTRSPERKRAGVPPPSSPPQSKAHRADSG